MSISNQGGKNRSWEATPGAAPGGICLLVGVAAVSRPPVLHGVESDSGRKRLRFLCGDALCPVLRGSYGASVDSAGHLLSDDVPDHSSISKTHKRLPKEVFDEVFQFILSVAARKKLLWGEALGIDSTTIQANASMKSIVRKDSGKGWKDYTKKLAKKAGLDDPTDDELRQFDRTRPEKKVSNATPRRTKGARGKLLSRARSELVERSFAHVCDTGGARRTWLRGLASVTKRHLMVAAARNLSTIMRVLFGIGCPKALQGLRALLQLAWTHFGLLLFGAEMPIDPVGRT